MPCSATFSACYKYRYSLQRVWDNSAPKVLFIGLNPSKANATQNDATILKLIKYSKHWGKGGFTICNLFALISTDPAKLYKTKDAMGPLNMDTLQDQIQMNVSTVFMWGNHGKLAGEQFDLLDKIPKPLCFGKNKNGTPKHPLYLPDGIFPQDFDVC